VEPSRTLERLRHRLSPASINSYYRCPRKFQFRYIRNVRMPFEFGPALAIGSVTHKALAEIFRQRRDGRNGASAESYVIPFLQRERYPLEHGDVLRMEHLPVIIDHVETALDALPAGAEIVDVEREFSYTFRNSVIGEDVSICSRVDLVVRHSGGVVDHIDFKTGSQGGDPVQNFLSRVTVVNSIDAPGEMIRTVNVLTKTGTYEVVPRARDAHAHVWEIVQTTIRNLSVDEEWTPRPEPAVCRWCDFRSICDHAQLESDSGDDD
jgi:hypothetical protein